MGKTIKKSKRDEDLHLQFAEQLQGIVVCIESNNKTSNIQIHPELLPLVQYILEEVQALPEREEIDAAISFLNHEEKRLQRALENLLLKYEARSLNLKGAWDFVGSYYEFCQIVKVREDYEEVLELYKKSGIKDDLPF